MPSPPTPPLSPDELERRILFERDGVVVVDKPWGLPSTGHHLDDPDSLQFALIARHGSMVWAVHQLDADTSGLNVFVKERKLVKAWQARLRFPSAEKSYVAVVHGELETDRTVDAPIGVICALPSKQLGISGDGRRAVTHFEPLDHHAGFSLVRARIETGRTHQIRIHATSIGHPLVGERWYRSPRCERHIRQALHASELRFHDGAEPARLQCPLATDLRKLVVDLGLRGDRLPWVSRPATG